MVSELKIVLASASPRRRMLLEKMGVKFEVKSPLIEEDTSTDDPEKRVLINAERKAGYFSDTEGYLVIGADTVVWLNGEILGKPVDREDAIRILKNLSGQVHKVYTGVSVLNTVSGVQSTEFCETIVQFKTLSDTQIQEYVENGEPFDKAGAYGIQGDGRDFVENIYGPVDNVIGLPLDLTKKLLVDGGLLFKD